MTGFNRFITSARSLVTSREEIRAGFLRIALEKNRINDPYVKNTLAFKAIIAGISSPDELLNIPEIRPFLLTASGLSEKSLTHLMPDDQTKAIHELIEKFLKPAGQNFIDELVFRYLLIKGDSAGGTMRNRIGVMGQEKFLRTLLSVMSVQNITCDKLNTKYSGWNTLKADSPDAETDVKALHWHNQRGHRLLLLNANIPAVRKNVDICLFSGDIPSYDGGRIVKNNEHAIMFGELKGGIDPAGADEHWKTGNTALSRIRVSFTENSICSVKTSFIGAAIEISMAEEIYSQLQDGILSNAANLTDNNQLTEYCVWLLKL